MFGAYPKKHRTIVRRYVHGSAVRSSGFHYPNWIGWTSDEGLRNAINVEATYLAALGLYNPPKGRKAYTRYEARSHENILAALLREAKTRGLKRVTPRPLWGRSGRFAGRGPKTTGVSIPAFYGKRLPKGVMPGWPTNRKMPPKAR